MSYIKREGVGLDGKKPELFGKEEGIAPNESKIENEKRFYKFIVSPENPGIDDMKEYVRNVMEKVEAKTGQKLEWAAAVHENTDNPHAHIVVRGVTQDGQETRFSKQMIQYGIRDIAEKQATLELGERSPEERHEQLKKEITANRYTTIDRSLQPDENNVVRGETLEQKARLNHLKEMGLAEKNSRFKSEYQLKSDWKEQLQERGIRNDIIKNLHRESFQPRITEKPITEYTISKHPKKPIEGTVIQTGMHNEIHDKKYALIKTKDGSYHYYAGNNSNDLQKGQSYHIGRSGQVHDLQTGKPDKLIELKELASKKENKEYNLQYVNRLEKEKAIIQKEVGDPKNQEAVFNEKPHLRQINAHVTNELQKQSHYQRERDKTREGGIER